MPTSSPLERCLRKGEIGYGLWRWSVVIIALRSPNPNDGDRIAEGMHASRRARYDNGHTRILEKAVCAPDSSWNPPILAIGCSSRRGPFFRISVVVPAAATMEMRKERFPFRAAPRPGAGLSAFRVPL